MSINSLTLQNHRRQSGSAIVAAILIVGVVTFIAGTVFLTATSAFRGTYHTAAWHESRLAADAGVDFGVAAVQKSLPDTNAYTWPGWKMKSSPTSDVTPGTDQARIITPSGDLLVNAGDGSTH